MRGRPIHANYPYGRINHIHCGHRFSEQGHQQVQPAYGVRALRACDVVELRLEPTNSYDDNADTIVGERGTQLGYVSAERAPLIGKRMKEGETIAVFQAMHGSGAYIRIRFGGGAPTLPDPVPDVPKRPPPRQARPAQRPVYDPHAFYPDEEGPEFGA